MPQDMVFSAARSGRWVAWSGMHNDRLHGGVFVRRLPPAAGPPLMIFNGRAAALSWGGDRLLLLLSAGEEQLVWAVWDPPSEHSDRMDGGNCVVPMVAPEIFTPNVAF